MRRSYSVGCRCSEKIMERKEGRYHTTYIQCILCHSDHAVKWQHPHIEMRESLIAKSPKHKQVLLAIVQQAAMTPDQTKWPQQMCGAFQRFRILIQIERQMITLTRAICNVLLAMHSPVATDCLIINITVKTKMTGSLSCTQAKIGIIYVYLASLVLYVHEHSSSYICYCCTSQLCPGVHYR